jgi:hypothetical protein
MSLRTVRLGSATSVDLTMSVKHAFNSLALLKASANIPGMSIPPTPEFFSVLEVGAVAVFQVCNDSSARYGAHVSPLVSRFDSSSLYRHDNYFSQNL